MDHYITALYKIITAGLKTNSYKFALWRALARLAPSTDERNPIISKNDLSPIFLDYYWPLETKYHIRRGTDPDKDPIVMRLIRQLINAGKIQQGETLREFRKKMPAEYNALVAMVGQKSFNHVIPRFHTVHRKSISPELFTFTGTVGKVGEMITLTTGGRKFLIEYNKLVDYVAVSGWVRFTEGCTSAPRLHDKIDGMNLIKGTVSHWRNPLIALQNGKCFYDESHDMSSPEVDHVLPWSFVLEDRTWNLVLACRKCNNEKRDRLPDTASLERLCGRNEKIAKEHISPGAKFLRHFVEWHSRDLSSHIKGLYGQAIADQFPKWR